MKSGSSAWMKDLSAISRRAPAFPHRFAPPKTPANRDAFQLVAFLDYGFGHNKSLFAGEPQTAYLFSIGPGCRYTYDPWVAVRADYAIQAASVSGPRR